jgi:hypothetical protein
MPQGNRARLLDSSILHSTIQHSSIPDSTHWGCFPDCSLPWMAMSRNSMSQDSILKTMNQNQMTLD